MKQRKSVNTCKKNLKNCTKVKCLGNYFSIDCPLDVWVFVSLFSFEFKSRFSYLSSFHGNSASDFSELSGEIVYHFNEKYGNLKKIVYLLDLPSLNLMNC